MAALLLLLPAFATAHTGDALDADGCHADHRTGEYHCHRGAAAGYSFPNREAMLEAVKTGKFPEKETVEKDSVWSRMWPWGGHGHEEKPTANSPETAPTGASASAPAPVSSPAAANAASAASGSAAAGAPATVAASPAASSPATDKENEFEQRLKILQGLYEMGLITKDEYEQKRKAVLDQL